MEKLNMNFLILVAIDPFPLPRRTRIVPKCLPGQEKIRHPGWKERSKTV
jgi:hypothetical protein